MFDKYNMNHMPWSSPISAQTIRDSGLICQTAHFTTFENILAAHTGTLLSIPHVDLCFNLSLICRCGLTERPVPSSHWFPRTIFQENVTLMYYLGDQDNVPRDIYGIWGNLTA